MDKEVVLKFRVTAGGMEVLDEAGRKIGELEKATAQFGQRSAGAFESASRSALVAGAAIGTAIAGGFALATRSVSEFVQRASRLNDLSQSVGVAARDLSALTVAAKLSGVELNELGIGLRFLNQNIAQAAAGSKNEVAAFTSLGVAVRSSTGELRSAAQVFDDLGEAFSRLPDGPQKTALAMQLLGRSGSQLIPVLNSGRDGLQALKLEAEQLGVVLDDSTVQAADRVGDSIDKLKLFAEGLSNSLGAALLPELEQATDASVKWAEANRQVISSEIGDWARGTATILREVVIPAFSGANAAINATGDLLGKVLYNPAESQRMLSQGALTRIRRGELNGVTADRAAPGEFGGLSNMAETPADGGMSMARESDLAGLRSTPNRAGGLLPFASPAASAASARTGRQPRNDLEQRTSRDLADAEQARLAVLEAQVSMRERAIKFAEQDLQLAKDSGASMQDQLRIAGQLDELDRQRLMATRERIQAELDGLLQFGPVASAEVIKLQDQLTGVNEELARGPQHARDLTAELKKTREVALDIGNTLNDSLQRAVDGLLNSNGNFNIKNILMGTLKAQASSFAGAAIQSIFTGGAVKIEGIDKLMSVFSGVVDMFGSLAGLGRPSSGIVAAAQSGTENSFPALVSAATGGSGVGVPSSASGSVAGAAGAGGGGAGAAGAAGAGTPAVAFAGALGSAAVTAYLGANLIGALGAQQRAESKITLANTISTNDIKKESGLFSPGAIAAAAAVPIVGQFYAIIAAIVQAFFQAPTQGSQRALALSNVLKAADVPQQGQYVRGERGVRAQFLTNAPGAAAAAAFAEAGYGFDLPGLRQPTLEQLAQGNRVSDPPQIVRLRQRLEAAALENPGVEALRTNEALAIGTATTGTKRGGALVANLLTNNFELLGVSADEARRQLLKIAEKTGVDLVGGLEDLNKAARRDRITRDQLITSGQGLVELFKSDLPKAINIDKIIADRTTANGQIDVAGVEAGLRGAQGAYNIRQQIADARLQRLDPRQQGTELRRRIAEIDRELSRTDLSDTQRQDALQRRADLGLQYAAYADQRFSGSQRTREAEYGYAIAEAAASAMEQLGKVTEEPTTLNTESTKSNTKETQNNTVAIANLTAAIKTGLKTTGTLDVTGIEGADAAEVEAIVRRVLKKLLQSPEIKADNRQAVP